MRERETMCVISCAHLPTKYWTVIVCLCHIYMLCVWKRWSVSAKRSDACVCVCVRAHCTPHSFSLSRSRTGNSNNNHKTYFIFSVWGETAAFPPCHHFPTRSSNRYTHIHTQSHKLSRVQFCKPGRLSELLHGVLSALLHFHFMSWEPSQSLST